MRRPSRRPRGRGFAPITSAVSCDRRICSRRATPRSALWAAELHAVHDRAIRQIVKYRPDLGLRGITDGEFRRTFFHVDFLTQLDGVVEKGGMTVKFHKADGDIDYAPPVMQVTGKVRHSRPIQRRDFQLLQSVTDRTPKVGDSFTGDAALSRRPRRDQRTGLSAARCVLQLQIDRCSRPQPARNWR